MINDRFHHSCDNGNLFLNDDGFCLDGFPPVYDFVAPSNVVLVELYVKSVLFAEVHFTMLFSRSSERSHVEFGVSFTSNYTGYLTPPGYAESPVYAIGLNASYNLILPQDRSVVILSVWPIIDHRGCCFDKILEVFEERRETGHAEPLPAKQLTKHDMIGFNRIFILNGHLRFHFNEYCEFKNRYRVRILFSFHSRSQPLPTVSELDKGTANCSTPLYKFYRQHIRCDLVMNCQSGEDERGCPHTSPDCDGHLYFLNKCYAFMLPPERGSSGSAWKKDVANPCALRGWSVVGVRNMDEYQTLRTLMKMIHFEDNPVVINVKDRFNTTPFYSMYTNVLRNEDKTVNYFLPVRKSAVTDRTPAIQPYNYPAQYWQAVFTDCEHEKCIYFCEFPSRFYRPPYRPLKAIRLAYLSSHLFFLNSRPSSHNPAYSTFSLASYKNASDVSAEGTWSDATTGPMLMRQCVNGDVVFTFMSCDQKHENATSAQKYDKFICDDGNTISYTLVCDFYADCADESDEAFCLHPQCGALLKCGASGQCVLFSAWCNSHMDCRNGQDEWDCDYPELPPSLGVLVPPPALVNFDVINRFTKTPLKDFESCPETHFPCPDSYCVPLFVVCNTISDCPGHDDEAFCQSYACPGFYRCRHVLVCLHPAHLCDGIIQCPLMDDELMCDVGCPRECFCQGLSTQCSQPFPVQQQTRLRYVDVSRTQMRAEEFDGNRYIVFLRLAKCRLESVDVLHLPNLQILDLRDNRIQSLHVDSFVRLTNLKQLLLSGNPIATVEQNDPGLTQSSLRLVDMSQSQIHVFDSRPFLQFEKIAILNISFSPLTTVSNDGFQHIPSLEVLDVRSTQLENFPRQVFLGLTKLTKIFADNYKLCCKATLPEHFSPGNCLAPVNELSSCEDLLRSDIYRACLWIFAVMATAGNIGSVVFKMWFQKENKGSGFNVFVIQLSVTDLCMGLYLVLIGIADARYRGQYLWYDLRWKHSVLCHTAGFFALFSAEASAFIILLITADRFIVFKFPFSDVRFNGMSALVACGLVWLSCGVLAGVPLLSVTSHWEYYSQTGICIPLPITRKDFAGRNYSFAVMIVLNLAVFLLIAAGQVSIYWSIHSSSMDAASSSESSAIRKTRDAAIARRLLAVVVSDFLCWFPVGLLGVLSTVGMPIPGWLNVAVAILILPINSAINPFLYTYNVLMETRRRVLKAERKIIMDKILRNFKENTPNAASNNA